MGNGCHQQAVEQGFAKISSVELVAVLVKVVLEVFPLDAVVHAKEQPLGVVDGDVAPRECLPRFLRWDHLGPMLFHHFPQSGIGGGAVRVDGGGDGNLVGNMRFDVLGHQAVDGHHFQVPHFLSLPFPPLLSFSSTGRLSAITNTLAFRWLPRPRLSGLPRSEPSTGTLKKGMNN